MWFLDVLDTIDDLFNFRRFWRIDLVIVAVWLLLHLTAGYFASEKAFYFYAGSVLIAGIIIALIWQKSAPDD
jgi:hypothetical protein